MSSELPMSRGCLICGRHNPIGFRIRFERAGEGVRATARAGLEFQGFGGIIHGGIVTAFLDDTMWYAVYAATGVITLTAEIQVRYRRPVHAGDDLVMHGEMTGKRHGLYTAVSRLCDLAGNVYAEAQGRFLKAPPEAAGELW